MGQSLPGSSASNASKLSAIHLLSEDQDNGHLTANQIFYMYAETGLGTKMVTGPEPAYAVAAAVGMEPEDVHAALLPEGKLNLVSACSRKLTVAAQ